MKKPPLLPDNFYHLFNRGVEKRKVFQNKADYERFMYSLEHFNTPDNVEQTERNIASPLSEVQPRTEGRQLVEIFAFALMPNHFHLLLQQKMDGGIAKFMQKVSTGYTMYFNKKNERVGPLFQGRYKAVLVEHEGQFMYIPHYVHKNPVDLAPTGVNKKKFLEEYPWSSYKDYISKDQRYPFVNRNFFLESCGGAKEYKKSFEEFDWGNENQEK